VWADAPQQRAEFRCEQVVAVDAARDHLWMFDTYRHRLLRARLPAPGAAPAPLVIDAVLGQADKTGSALNRGQPAPGARTLGRVNDAKFDRLGNLFVVDNTYEGHPNGRVIAFAAEDLARINTLFPEIDARHVYCVDNLSSTQWLRVHAPFDHPHSPVCVAFNSRNEMVIGNDGYYRDHTLRHVRQLFLYRRPLEKHTPDAIITLPLGAPGEICFDEDDNLIVQDHTWNKVWVLNFDRDADWTIEIENGK
jgi:hypothetical protein